MGFRGVSAVCVCVVLQYGDAEGDVGPEQMDGNSEEVFFFLAYPDFL